MQPHTPLTPPDLDMMTALARDVLAGLPAPFSQAAQGIALQVVDFAPDEMLADMGIDDPFELTGLYDGTPLTERSVMDQLQHPDTIWLFRRPILDEWIHRGDIALAELVAHVVLHELAHHFGWSDDDIARVAPWQDI